MDTTETYFNEVAKGAQDVIFSYHLRVDQKIELDKLEKPMYNIAMAYLGLMKKYYDKEYWDSEIAVDCAKRLADRIINLEAVDDKKAGLNG